MGVQGDAIQPENRYQHLPNPDCSERQARVTKRLLSRFSRQRDHFLSKLGRTSSSSQSSPGKANHPQVILFSRKMLLR